MSWLLGHQVRSALPESLVSFLEQQSRGELRSITWAESDRHTFTAHFDKNGRPFEDRIFKYRSALEQATRTRRTG